MRGQTKRSTGAAGRIKLDGKSHPAAAVISAVLTLKNGQVSLVHLQHD